MYVVIPVTIDFVNLLYTGKSTLLQMWGHFILSKYVYVRYIILNESSKNIDKHDVFGRFSFCKVAKSGYIISKKLS